MDDANNTMSDSSGNGQDGTSNSNVLLQQPGSTNFGYGFTTAPSYVQVPSSSAMNPESGNFSVTAHVRFSKLPADEGPGDDSSYDIIRKGLSTTTGGDWKMEIVPTGVARCSFRDSDRVRVLIIGAKPLNDGEWHTITCHRTPTQLRLTVDGESRTNDVSTGDISNTDEVLLGAKDRDGADQYFGDLDEVSISRA